MPEELIALPTLCGVPPLCCVAALIVLVPLLQILAADHEGKRRAEADMNLPRRRKGFDGMVRESQKKHREYLKQQRQSERERKIQEREALKQWREQEKQARQQALHGNPRLDVPAAQLPVAEFDLFNDLTPTGFEKVIGDHFRRKGFYVQHTGGSADGGVDLWISKNGKVGIVQCKRYRRDNAVGSPSVRDLRGAMLRENAVCGYLITTSRFTDNAVKEAAAVQTPPIKLIDGDMLLQIMREEQD